MFAVSCIHDSTAAARCTSSALQIARQLLHGTLSLGVQQHKEGAAGSNELTASLASDVKPRLRCSAATNVQLAQASIATSSAGLPRHAMLLRYMICGYGEAH